MALPWSQVPRLQATVRDRRANWEQSLATLRAAKTFGARVTKTSIMLGCGESADEVLEALRLLRENGARAMRLDSRSPFVMARAKCCIHTRGLRRS